MRPGILLDELTREEARACAAQSLVVLPVGATEQHGPHLPIATDSMAVEHLARAAVADAAAQIPVLVAPTLRFGSSHHHLQFGGTMSLSTETYYRVLCELGESLIISGFSRIFIVNGHGGNQELVQLAARDLALKYPVHVAAGTYWTMAWDDLVAEQAHVRGELPGHAGAFEASLVLAMRPDLVREPRPHRDGAAGSDPRRAVDSYRSEVQGWWQGINGYTDSPDRGDAARGQAYLSAAARAVARVFIEFYRATEGSQA